MGGASAHTTLGLGTPILVFKAQALPCLYDYMPLCLYANYI